jgi:hypothetical protein
MFENNFEVEDIAKATNLSIEEINKIKKENNF